MITNFKIFEHKEYNVYWKVRTDQPYFDVSCWKIGVPEGRFGFAKNKEYLKELKVGKYVYIQNFYNGTECRWEWDKLKKHVNNNLEYKGEVKVTKNDIEKWKLYNNIKKYNI
jgi:hypothetical protein